MDVDTYQQRARECLRFAATSFDLEDKDDLAGARPLLAAPLRACRGAAQSHSTRNAPCL